jgi:hypothetical protein
LFLPLGGDGVAIALALGVLPAFFAIQFVVEIWATTSIDHIRLAVKLLLYIGIALFLFATVRVFLPRAAYGEEAVRVAGACIR